VTRRRICVITGSRADYGLLRPVMSRIVASSDLDLQLIALGGHYSAEHGLTYQVIESDGFAIDASVDCLDATTADDIPQQIAETVTGTGAALARLDPDLVLVLGDRYEILAAVLAATIARIPIAHIAGGDTTEGAYDEAFRHSITKMSHLHFVTNSDSARRVRQLGESPRSIYSVGSPGLDSVRHMPLLGRADIASRTGIRFSTTNLLVTLHAETLAPGAGGRHTEILLDALGATPRSTSIIFTLPNSDSEGPEIASRIRAFCASHPGRSFVFESLGQELYFSLLATVDAVVGNSSSGLYEAPSFGTPTVNIGDRQKGRLAAASVLSCAWSVPDIEEALAQALERGRRATDNPYGDGHSAERIVEVLEARQDYSGLLRKQFVDLPVQSTEY
jgi:UDP-hydrolysing UDP-N-acetyl-D-glucosamine 2-epimerase